MRMSNLDLSLDFEGLTLFWLGKSAEGESLALVEKLYGSARNDDLREDLLAAAGCHGTPALVIPFLSGILGGSGPDEQRKNAAFWIGQQNDAEGLRLLVGTAGRTVRKRSAKARSSPSARSSSRRPSTRSSAWPGAPRKRMSGNRPSSGWGRWLRRSPGGRSRSSPGRTGTPRSRSRRSSPCPSFPDDQGVDALIKLAKTHPDPRIRKKAVFWLGECDDPRALETLVKIVKGK